MERDIKKAIGERIRIVRGELNREEFAQKTGSHRNSIMSYEHGKATPKMELMARICEEFGIVPNWLLLGIGPKYWTDQQPEKTAPPPQKGNGNGQIGFIEDPFITDIKLFLNEKTAEDPGWKTWFKIEVLRNIPVLREWYEKRKENGDYAKSKTA